MSDFHNTPYLDEVPIIKKTYDLYKLYYGYLALFPKKDKYALGNKCELYLVAVLELLLAAGSLPKDRKGEAIQQASVKFDALKVFLRMQREFGLLDNKKYLTLQTPIQEIGRMLGGWQRSLK
jgi:hypothetical protein